MARHTTDDEVRTALRRARDGDVDGARRQLTVLLDSTPSPARVYLGLTQLEWRTGQVELAGRYAAAGLAASTAQRHEIVLLLGMLALVETTEETPDQAVRRLDHPAVRLALASRTPIAAALLAVLAVVECARDRPEPATRLLGAAHQLGRWDDVLDIDTAAAARSALARLGDARFSALYSAGESAPWASTQELVAASLAVSG
ncbi:hypothetical protein [Cryptosporangium sp. NPDC051539]|uniref:hypothetical protein n=1 Tax=Cryptosporangium sp. NPDC051539 TaxID=3363962 RepID=UPI0037B1FFC4